MGITGISPLSLLLILAIVLLLFGPKRLGQVGHSLGQAIRQFRGAMDETEHKEDEAK